MDSLDVVLHRAFGVVFCIYGVRSLAEAIHRQARQARAFHPVARASAGLLLLVSGAITVLTLHHSVACYVAAPAIGLLVLIAVLERRASEAIDLALLGAAFLYLVTA